MNRKLVVRFEILTLALFLAFTGLAFEGHAAPALEPNLAANNPDEFAWQLFAAVNRPAGDRGQESIWETWAEQATVYADPCEKPEWPGVDPNSGSFSSQRSPLVDIMESRRENRQVSEDDFNALTGDCNLQQVKLNRPFFNYVVENDLWYQEGVIQKAMTDGIDFPAEALVYKADWALIDEDEKDRYHWRWVTREEYEEAFGGGQSQSGFGGKISAEVGGGNACLDDLPAGKGPLRLGLVAFHIVNKAIDNWVWTTWNQAETLGRCDYIGCRDDFGSDPAAIPPHREMGRPYDPGKLTSGARSLINNAGLTEAWHNYRLMGTMVAFTDLRGRPNLLGNAVLEPSFGNTSSCITCHAMATLSATGESLNFLKSTQPFEGFVGTPDPSWFYPSNVSGPATPIVYQTDFMWQLATEAKSREEADCGL